MALILFHFLMLRYSIVEDIKSFKGYEQEWLLPWQEFFLLTLSKKRMIFC